MPARSCRGLYAVPPVNIGQYDILDPTEIPVDISVHFFSPGRQVGQSQIPLTVVSRK